MRGDRKEQIRIEAMHAASRIAAGVYAAGDSVGGADTLHGAIVIIAEELVKWIEKREKSHD